MMAFKRLRKLGWPMLFGVCGLTIHVMGLYVAPLRTELRSVEKNIQERKGQIAYLEAEMSARASLDRLNLYNQMLYGYEAPRPDQYLNGEQALASLGGKAVNGEPVMTAIATEAPAPVLAGAIAGVDESLPADGQTIELSMPVESKNNPQSAAQKARAKEDVARTERMAGIDRQLLATETLRSIEVADTEGRAE